MIWAWMLAGVAVWVVVSALIWGFGERQFFNKTGIRYVEAEKITQDILKWRGCSNLATLKSWIFRDKMGEDIFMPGTISDFEILIIENYDPREWEVIAIFWPVLSLFFLIKFINKTIRGLWKNIFCKGLDFIFKCLKKMFLTISEVVMLGADRAEPEVRENNLKGPYR